MIQSDLADESADMRRDHLRDELDLAVSKMLPEERRAFVDALKDRFPAWDSGSRVAEQDDPVGVSSPMDRREAADPVLLAERLAETAGGLSDRQRESVMAILSRAGLQEEGGRSISSLSDFAEAAGVSDAALIDPERALIVAAQLLAMVDRLDQLAWSTWKQMAKSSDLRRRSPLKQTIARYTAGEESSSAQVSEDAERVRQLIAALLSSFSQVGSLAYRNVARFSPEEIARFARQDKKLLEGLEVACWRKYQELAGSVDQAGIEAEILKGVCGYAETLVTGAGR